MPSSLRKTFGLFVITASEPWPRSITIERTDHKMDGYKLSGLSLESARDLHYALGRIIAMANAEDGER